MSMDTEASLREYLKLHLRIPVVGRIGPLAKAFDFVATAAPGVREILTVGKLCWEVRERHYDLVVVDAPASGHIVGQLAAPQAINDLVKVGLIRSQTDWMLEILSDARQTGLVAVCTPEEMPVSETLELADAGRARRRRCACRPWSSTASCPSSSASARRRSSSSCARPRPKRVLSERAGGDGGPGARGGPARRHHAAHPVGPPAAAPGRPARGPAGAPVALPLRAQLRAPAPPARWPTRSARSSGCDGGAHRPRPPRRSGQLLAAKDIVIACGPGGVGKTTTAAAAGRHGGGRAGRPGAGAHGRPGAPAGRRARG